MSVARSPTTFEEPADAAVGDLVDQRYRLKREIARGGMGAIFQAEHVHLGRSVAVKLLHSGYQYREDMRLRLLREARALAVARHPNLVEVYDAGVCPGSGPYVAMEMLDGRTLDGILAARGRLPIEEVAHIGRQLCDALAFAHARGVVHRDVKPSNIFIARTELGDEIVKLVDFGIALLDAERLSDTDSKITKGGELLGTFDYMAPEQLLAKEIIDYRCDIYSIGVTLYECLTAEVPYGGSFKVLVTRILGGHKPRPLRSLRFDVPEEFAEAIEHALEIDPDHRYTSAFEFAEAVARASGLESGQTSLLAAGARIAETASHPAPPDERPTMAGPSQDILLAAKSVKPAPPKLDDSPISRRRTARAPYVTPIRLLRSKEVAADGRTEDVSEGGMLAIVDHPLKMGERVKIRFATPMEGTLITIEADVRWVKEARGRVALGLEFVELTDVARASIKQYVQIMLPSK